MSPEALEEFIISKIWFPEFDLDVAKQLDFLRVTECKDCGFQLVLIIDFYGAY
jgi:hypothetical protein